MFLSIIIVNWNSRDYLRACLNSIRAQPPACAYEIIVVDGGSFDGCAEMLARDFPQVVFIQSRENIGFARANNLGVERATGATLLFLNPDTEVFASALDRLLEALHSRPDAGIVAPKLLNTDGSLQTSCVQALPTPINQMLDSELLHRSSPRFRMWGMSALRNDASPGVVEAVPGACLMIRADLFRRLGGFCSQYFMYAEDMDLCDRVRRAGLQVYYVPASRVRHHGGGSSKSEGSKFSNVMMRESIHRFFLLNRGRGTAASYRLAMLLSAPVRLLLLLPLCLLGQTRRRLAARKWIAIFRWALGFEAWAAGYPGGGAVARAGSGKVLSSSVSVP